VKGQLLQLIRDSGPMSRSELARRLDLSATTVTRVVNDLEADQVLIEGAALAPAGAGRPAITLHIRADACLVAAVQIGIGVVHIGIFNARAERRSDSHFNYSIGASPESVLRRSGWRFCVVQVQRRQHGAAARRRRCSAGSGGCGGTAHAHVDPPALA